MIFVSSSLLVVSISSNQSVKTTCSAWIHNSIVSNLHLCVPNSTLLRVVFIHSFWVTAQRTEKKETEPKIFYFFRGNCSMRHWGGGGWHTTQFEGPIVSERAKFNCLFLTLPYCTDQRNHAVSTNSNIHKIPHLLTVTMWQKSILYPQQSSI